VVQAAAPVDRNVGASLAQLARSSQTSSSVLLAKVEQVVKDRAVVSNIVHGVILCEVLGIPRRHSGTSAQANV
jgi:exopolysaccharide biosynthesis predicted pyruvyltransferase EpsI